MKEVLDLVGQRFGRLLVLERDVKVRVSPTDGRTRRDYGWKCLCDCGNINYPTTQALVHKEHPTVSCGCFQQERKTRHGMSYSVEYARWVCMKERCMNTKAVNYKDYGGRGISICSDWISSFENFFMDMGECPNGFSLERKDVNGDYHKDNCMWADKYTQAANQRTSVRNTSGRTGVFWDGVAMKWRPAIRTRGKLVYLGSYESFDDAVRIREQAELKYFGFIKSNQ